MAVLAAATQAAETFTPYQSGNVPQNVTDLWKDYDAQKEPLDIKVVKEWKTDGVVTRYVTFKVERLKGPTLASPPTTPFLIMARRTPPLCGATVEASELNVGVASILQSRDSPQSTSTGSDGRWSRGSMATRTGARSIRLRGHGFTPRH
jgi:hypothetical protein